jgi:probable rRNA maturation factor
MPVAIRNQQRLHKVATARLKKLAQRALDLVAVGRDEPPARPKPAGDPAGRPHRAQSKCNLSLVLMDDAGIRKLNRDFHHTDAPTDVLSFDYGGGELEVIVNVERAFDVAEQYRNTASRELALYIVHGILHLHSHDDVTPAKRRRMRAAQQRLLKTLLSRRKSIGVAVCRRLG